MSSLFFFNDTATTEIYTLSLHDALPICADHLLFPGPHGKDLNRSVMKLPCWAARSSAGARSARTSPSAPRCRSPPGSRSEEHTSELQSRQYLVCRLLLEKKKNKLPSVIC